MAWYFTKLTFKNMSWILPLLAVLVGAIFAFQVPVINELLRAYCSDGNPVSCVVQADVLVVGATLGVLFLAAVSVPVVADLIIGGFESLKLRIVRSMRRGRRGRLVFPALIMHNEIYVIVRNDEFFLDAGAVSARTDFAWNVGGPHVAGYLPWRGEPRQRAMMAIPRKSERLLHFATVSLEDETLTIHLDGGDRNFPMPDNSYGFPIRFAGSMRFLGLRTGMGVDRLITLVVCKANGILTADTELTM